MILDIIQGLPKFHIIDFVDIILVAVLFYYLYKLLKGTNALNILIGFILIYITSKVVKYLEMKLLTEILDQFISVGVIALIIIFQSEIRRFLILLGSNGFLDKWKKLIFWKNDKVSKNKLDSSAIVLACNHLSQSYTGALIVICKTNPLEQIIQTGDVFESEINSQLLETIFFKNTPLHDGAVIVKDNKIQAARCILPVSKNNNIPVSMGLRHRSAIGITETSDAISVIVSEQTGKISIVKQGVVKHGISSHELQTFLDKEFNS
ncbi:MAG: diadenylate cyclase CdaA [Bacteroidales bacterium]|nr:diadenylate cyclase CdaA [Bacteroidales bacterium]